MIFYCHLRHSVRHQNVSFSVGFINEDHIIIYSLVATIDLTVYILNNVTVMYIYIYTVLLFALSPQVTPSMNLLVNANLLNKKARESAQKVETTKIQTREIVGGCVLC